MVGSSEVDGGGNNGVWELSSARTTMAGVPQVTREYERGSSHGLLLFGVFENDVLFKRPLCT